MSRTPGSWSVREAYSNGEPCGFVVHSGAIDICEVASRDDADLLAAAPDLYAACDEADTALAVIGISELTPQARGCVREAWPMVQAARAKARPGGVYAEVIDEAHKSEISRLDAINSDLQAALEMMLDYVNGLPAIPCISKAMVIVGAARSALSKAKGVSV